MRHQGKIPTLFVNVSAQSLNQKHWIPVLKLEYETTWQHTWKELRGLKMPSSNNKKKSMIEWRRCSGFLKNSQQVKLWKKWTLEEVDGKGEVENRINNSQLGTPRKTSHEKRKMECEAYHSLLVESMRKAMLKKMITKKEDMRETS
ncbi:hypothetical protein Tco_0066294 [Tanacetum coccineum]